MFTFLLLILAQVPVTDDSLYLIGDPVVIEENIYFRATTDHCTVTETNPSGTLKAFATSAPIFQSTATGETYTLELPVEATNIIISGSIGSEPRELDRSWIFTLGDKNGYIYIWRILNAAPEYMGCVLIKNPKAITALEVNLTTSKVIAGTIDGRVLRYDLPLHPWTFEYEQAAWHPGDDDLNTLASMTFRFGSAEDAADNVKHLAGHEAIVYGVGAGGTDIPVLVVHAFYTTNFNERDVHCWVLLNGPLPNITNQNSLVEILLYKGVLASKFARLRLESEPDVDPPILGVFDVDYEEITGHGRTPRISIGHNGTQYGLQMWDWTEDVEEGEEDPPSIVTYVVEEGGLNIFKKIPIGLHGRQRYFFAYKSKNPLMILPAQIFNTINLNVPGSGYTDFPIYDYKVISEDVAIKIRSYIVADGVLDYEVCTGTCSNYQHLDEGANAIGEGGVWRRYELDEWAEGVSYDINLTAGYTYWIYYADLTSQKIFLSSLSAPDLMELDDFTENNPNMDFEGNLVVVWVKNVTAVEQLMPGEDLIHLSFGIGACNPFCIEIFLDRRDEPVLNVESTNSGTVRVEQMLLRPGKAWGFGEDRWSEEFDVYTGLRRRNSIGWSNGSWWHIWPYGHAAEINWYTYDTDAEVIAPASITPPPYLDPEYTHRLGPIVKDIYYISCDGYNALVKKIEETVLEAPAQIDAFNIMLQEIMYKVFKHPGTIGTVGDEVPDLDAIIVYHDDGTEDAGDEYTYFLSPYHPYPLPEPNQFVVDSISYPRDFAPGADLRFYEYGGLLPITLTPDCITGQYGVDLGEVPNFWDIVNFYNDTLFTPGQYLFQIISAGHEHKIIKDHCGIVVPPEGRILRYNRITGESNYYFFSFTYPATGAGSLPVGYEAALIPGSPVTGLLDEEGVGLTAIYIDAIIFENGGGYIGVLTDGAVVAPPGTTNYTLNEVVFSYKENSTNNYTSYLNIVETIHEEYIGDRAEGDDILYIGDACFSPEDGGVNCVDVSGGRLFKNDYDQNFLYLPGTTDLTGFHCLVDWAYYARTRCTGYISDTGGLDVADYIDDLGHDFVEEIDTGGVITYIKAIIVDIRAADANTIIFDFLLLGGGETALPNITPPASPAFPDLTHWHIVDPVTGPANQQYTVWSYLIDVTTVDLEPLLCVKQGSELLTSDPTAMYYEGERVSTQRDIAGYDGVGDLVTYSYIDESLMDVAWSGKPYELMRLSTEPDYEVFKLFPNPHAMYSGVFDDAENVIYTEEGIHREMWTGIYTIYTEDAFENNSARFSRNFDTPVFDGVLGSYSGELEAYVTRWVDLTTADVPKVQYYCTGFLYNCEDTFFDEGEGETEGEAYVAFECTEFYFLGDEEQEFFIYEGDITDESLFVTEPECIADGVNGKSTESFCGIWTSNDPAQYDQGYLFSALSDDLIFDDVTSETPPYCGVIGLTSAVPNHLQYVIIETETETYDRDYYKGLIGAVIFSDEGPEKSGQLIYVNVVPTDVGGETVILLHLYVRLSTAAWLQDTFKFDADGITFNHLALNYLEAGEAKAQIAEYMYEDLFDILYEVDSTHQETVYLNYLDDVELLASVGDTTAPSGVLTSLVEISTLTPYNLDDTTITVEYVLASDVVESTVPAKYLPEPTPVYTHLLPNGSAPYAPGWITDGVHSAQVTSIAIEEDQIIGTEMVGSVYATDEAAVSTLYCVGTSLTGNPWGMSISVSVADYAPYIGQECTITLPSGAVTGTITNIGTNFGLTLRWEVLMPYVYDTMPAGTTFTTYSHTTEGPETEDCYEHLGKGNVSYPDNWDTHFTFISSDDKPLGSQVLRIDSTTGTIAHAYLRQEVSTSGTTYYKYWCTTTNMTSAPETMAAVVWDPDTETSEMFSYTKITILDTGQTYHRSWTPIPTELTLLKPLDPYNLTELRNIVTYSDCFEYTGVTIPFPIIDPYQGYCIQPGVAADDVLRFNPKTQTISAAGSAGIPVPDTGDDELDKLFTQITDFIVPEEGVYINWGVTRDVSTTSIGYKSLYLGDEIHKLNVVSGNPQPTSYATTGVGNGLAGAGWTYFDPHFESPCNYPLSLYYYCGDEASCLPEFTLDRLIDTETLLMHTYAQKDYGVFLKDKQLRIRATEDYSPEPFEWVAVTPDAFEYVRIWLSEYWEEDMLDYIMPFIQVYMGRDICQNNPPEGEHRWRGDIAYDIPIYCSQVNEGLNVLEVLTVFDPLYQKNVVLKDYVVDSDILDFWVIEEAAHLGLDSFYTEEEFLDIVIDIFSWENGSVDVSYATEINLQLALDVWYNQTEPIRSTYHEYWDYDGGVFDPGRCNLNPTALMNQVRINAYKPILLELLPKAVALELLRLEARDWQRPNRNRLGVDCDLRQTFIDNFITGVGNDSGWWGLINIVEPVVLQAPRVMYLKSNGDLIVNNVWGTMPRLRFQAASPYMIKVLRSSDNVLWIQDRNNIYYGRVVDDIALTPLITVDRSDYGWFHGEVAVIENELYCIGGALDPWSSDLYKFEMPPVANTGTYIWPRAFFATDNLPWDEPPSLILIADDEVYVPEEE